MYPASSFVNGEFYDYDVKIVEAVTVSDSMNPFSGHG